MQIGKNTLEICGLIHSLTPIGDRTWKARLETIQSHTEYDLRWNLIEIIRDITLIEIIVP